MASMNISLPDTMREWVEQQTKTGEYANSSDYMRDLIRHDQRQREQLRLALIEGEQSGRSSLTVMEILAEEKLKPHG